MHFHRRSPIKESVRVATTANITIATALNNGDVLDGITLATDDRVLVKDQSTASQNGLYVVAASPARAYDQSIDDPAFGFLVRVRQGTVNASTVWANTNTAAPTIGTTGLTFAQVTSAAGGGTDLGWFVVTDPAYGAVGDNATDDTAAIQAAIDAAVAAGGGVIYFPLPSVAYKITATLTIAPASVGHIFRLVGVGEYDIGSKIRMATVNTTAFSVNNNASFSVFENLWIEGPSGNSSGAGIAGDFHTREVRVLGFYNGLALDAGSYYSKHYKSWFRSNQNAGAVLASGGNNAEFVSCYSALNAIGYDFAGALSPKIIGGSCELNTTCGVRANGGTNSAGLYVAGVYLEHANGIPDILLGNLTNTKGVTVEGNTFVKPAYTGSGWHIDGQNVTGLTVSGNAMDSTDAVRAVGSSSGVVLVNNYLRNSGTITIPAGSINIDTTSTAPPAVGTAAAGTSSKVARADHVHAPGGTAGGDLSGTYPNPTVVDDSHLHTSATVTGAGAEILVSDTPIGVPLVFADLLQNEAETDLIYSD